MMGRYWPVIGFSLKPGFHLDFFAFCCSVLVFPAPMSVSAFHCSFVAFCCFPLLFVAFCCPLLFFMVFHYS